MDLDGRLLTGFSLKSDSKGRELLRHATCKNVSDSFTNKDSLEYQILYGGISLDNIDYVDFTDAMMSIGWGVESGTYDPRDMYDYWEEAALKEATNDYE